MLSGNRSLYVAFAAVLVVGVAAGWLLAHPSVSKPYQSPDANREACEKGDYRSCDTQPKILFPVGDKPNAESTEQNAYRGEYRAEKDLEAQQWMAFWAMFMGIATGATVILVFLTLVEANETAKAAVDAGKAAWASEKTARDIGQKQSMAYVHASSGKLTTKSANALTLLDPNKEDRFTLTIENLGETVAKNIQVLYGFDAVDTSFIGRIPPKPIWHGVVRNIAPKSSAPFSFDWKLHDLWEKMKKITIDESSDILRIYGEVRYWTVFGQQFRSQFMFWIPPLSFGKDEKILLFDNPRLGLATFEEIKKKQSTN